SIVLALFRIHSTRKKEEGKILRYLGFKLFICLNLSFDCYSNKVKILGANGRLPLLILEIILLGNIMSA
uniref:hypothetical protein n=1 Tax=Okeania hirsuta TaxID=1458930 RepID=UPI000FA6C076